MFPEVVEHGIIVKAAQRIVIPNTVVDEGEESYLKMIFRADVADVSAGGDFFVGLCDQVPAETDTLTSITSEPSVSNGYARIALTRDGVGWPTLDTVNGRKRILSKTITFTASGGDFDAPFSRACLCNVASGTSGILFSYSGALSAAVTLLDGVDFAMQYEVFLD